MPSDTICTRPAAAPLRLLLTTREAAQALGVSQRYLYGITAPRCTLPVIEMPGRNGTRTLRYSVAVIAEWIEQHQERTTAERATRAPRPRPGTARKAMETAGASGG